MNAAGRRRLRAWILGISAAVLILGLAMFAWRYDVESLDAGAAGVRGLIRSGAVVVFGPVDEDAALGEGSLVEAVVVNGQPGGGEGEGARGRILSRIAAGPGQLIRLEPRSGGRTEILIDGRRTWALLEPAAGSTGPLREGPVPEGTYLLLNPDPDAPAVDSRQLGCIPRSAIVRKVLGWR